MLNKSTPNTKRLKELLTPLTPLSLSDVSPAQSLDIARQNLKQFYGCVDGHLVIILSNLKFNGQRVQRSWEGIRRDGKWLNASTELNARSTPHDAVISAVSYGDYCSVTIDVDRIDNLSELFFITESGRHYDTFDFLISCNVVLGGSSPFFEWQENYYTKLKRLIDSTHKKAGVTYHDGVWVQDETSYSLFSNDDPYLQKFGGFHNYAAQNGMYWRWRSVFEPHTRLIDWLLLGDFGLHPSESNEGDELQLAA